MGEENNVHANEQLTQEEKIRKAELDIKTIEIDYLEKLMIKKREMEIERINKDITKLQQQIKDHTKEKEAEITKLEKIKFSMIRKKQYEESEKVAYNPEKRKAKRVEKKE